MTEMDRRDPGPLGKLLRRVREVAASREYRRALWARTLCRALHRLNPDVRYLVLARGDDLTAVFVDDAVITPYAIASGGFQERELAAVIEWCGRIGAPLGGAFIDVGANCGTTTLQALRSGRFSRAIAIEPAPANLALLRLNVTLNGLRERVEIVPAAVSSERGSAILLLSPDNTGDHRIGRSALSGDRARRSVDVPTSSLDAIVAEAGVSANEVSFVWVDTQGHESLVLAGATQLISAGVPFCIEFWPSVHREGGTLDQLIRIVESRFAAFVDLGDERPHARPVDRIRSFSEEFARSTSITDLFLIPKGMIAC